MLAKLGFHYVEDIMNLQDYIIHPVNESGAGKWNKSEAIEWNKQTRLYLGEGAVAMKIQIIPAYDHPQEI